MLLRSLDSLIWHFFRCDRSLNWYNHIHCMSMWSISSNTFFSCLVNVPPNRNTSLCSATLFVFKVLKRVGPQSASLVATTGNCYLGFFSCRWLISLLLVLPSIFLFFGQNPLCQCEGDLKHIVSVKSNKENKLFLSGKMMKSCGVCQNAKKIFCFINLTVFCRYAERISEHSNASSIFLTQEVYSPNV